MVYLKGVLILLSLSIALNAERILFLMPFPSISHQIVARSLTKLLLDEAEVAMLTPNPAYPDGEAPANLTEIDLDPTDIFNLKMRRDTSVGDKSFADVIEWLFEQLQKPNVKRVLAQNVDIMIMESTFVYFVRMATRAPLVQFCTIGTLFTADTEGSLTHYRYYPNSLRRRVDNLSAWEILTELFGRVYLLHAYGRMFEKYRRIYEEIGPIGGKEDTIKQVQFTLQNANALWDGNRPRPLNVVYVGGIYNPRKDLPQDLNDYLDSSSRGVIYVSFGTSVPCSQIPDEKIRAMVLVLSRMPYDVLWKWDGDLPMAADNIRVAKWFPQVGLLNHRNIKLFVTQAGMHSCEDAIHAGVPLVAIPLQGDQWYNAEKIVHFKIGEHINLADITEQSFRNVVEHVINNEMVYRSNVARLRAWSGDQPQTPAQRVAWALRRARLRHGEALRSPAAHLPLHCYYELELVMVAIAAVMTFVALAFYICRRVWAILCKITNAFSLY